MIHPHTVTLQGGPLDGHERGISSVMDTEIPVESTDTGEVLKETP